MRLFLGLEIWKWGTAANDASTRFGLTLASVIVSCGHREPYGLAFGQLSYFVQLTNRFAIGLPKICAIHAESSMTPKRSTKFSS
jgi:hypothetical protein